MLFYYHNEITFNCQYYRTEKREEQKKSRPNQIRERLFFNFHSS